MQAGDEPIAESSHSLARRAATAGDPKTDLTYEAPSRAVDHFTGFFMTQRSTTLVHPTSEEGEVLLLKNSDDKLDYLQRKNARLDKQPKVTRLRT